MADGELVVARGDRAVEVVYPALDRMALAVVGRVEARRPAATGTEPSAVARLVGFVWDGAANPAATQVGAVPAGGVRLVRADPVGADAWPGRPDMGQTHFLQYGFELRRVAALPGRDDDRQGLLALLDGQVQLGGEPAARAPKSVITRFAEDPARRFLLQITLLAGPGRMLMGTADRGVDAQVPRDRTFRVGQGLQPGEYPVPGAVPLPSAEQVVDPAPRSVLDGDVPPRHTGPDPEPYAVDQPPPGPDRWPTCLRAFRQQRFQHRPLLVREISPTHEL